MALTRVDHPSNSSTATIFSKFKFDSITNIIPKALLEGFIASVSATAAAHFSSDNTKHVPYVNAVIIESINLLLRLKPEPSPCWALNRRNARALIFAYLDFITRGILIHESGHFTAMEMIARNAEPNITLQSGYLVTSGLTSWNLPNNTFNYTQFGARLGYNNSMAFMLAAGDMMTCIWNLFALTLAQFVPSDYIEIKSYLRFMVAVSTVDMLGTLLSSANSSLCDLGNDDCEMRKYGLNPMALVSVLLLFMLMWQFGLSKLADAFCPTRSECNSNNEAIDDNNDSAAEIIEDGINEASSNLPTLVEDSDTTMSEYTPLTIAK